MTAGNLTIEAAFRASVPSAHVARVMELIRERRGFDLSSYKRNPIARSIARRAAACRCATIAEYCALAEAPGEDGDAELAALLSQITVEYSEFFRDRSLFDLLRDRVIPGLIRRAAQRTRHPLRLWCVGCAGGEEAYSLAITVLETLGDTLPGAEVRLFATDVDPLSLARARAGRYRRDELAGVDPGLLQRYFDGGRVLTVRRSVRELIRFGEHNLLGDPPISKLDLISCRNVLMYLEKDAQVRALVNLRYGLLPGGCLVLGRTEQLRPEVAAAFEPVDEAWRLYRKREDLRQ